MSTTVAAQQEERPVLAIGMLVLAMLLFISTDGISKYLSTSMTTQQIIWARYGVIIAIVLPLMWRRESRGLLRTRHPLTHVLRGVLLLLSSVMFVAALRELPLELCTAIGFAAPLYVTALSIPLLHEKVGVRRWSAVGVGFLGVIVILRPGQAAFQWAMLLPLVSSFFWALGLVLTRRMRSSEAPLTVLVYSSLVGWLLITPLALPVWHHPSGFEWLLLLAIGFMNAIGQYLVIRAFMMASASMLAPFSYSAMVWAVLIGATVFGTFPDLPTLVGTLVLIAAGLYVWHRERVRKSMPAE